MVPIFVFIVIQIDKINIHKHLSKWIKIDGLPGLFQIGGYRRRSPCAIDQKAGRMLKTANTMKWQGNGTMHKIGIFNWYGYVEPFEKRVEQIKKAGYDHLMLWWEDESYPKHIDRRDFIKIVKSYDLNLDNIHLPSEGINTLWSDGMDRIKKVDEFAMAQMIGTGYPAKVQLTGIK